MKSYNSNDLPNTNILKLNTYSNSKQNMLNISEVNPRNNLLDQREFLNNSIREWELKNEGNNILISKIFYIYEGQIKFYSNNKFIKEIETNGIFADISYGMKSQTMNNDILIADGDVKCYTIDVKFFRENVDENYFNYIQSILVLQDVSIELKNLFYVKTIGQGKYGHVLLVHNRKNLYALKIANIDQIKKRPYLIKYYYNEKKVMQETDHPFIVKFVKTIKSDDRIFFLMEYIDGITMKFYIEKKEQRNFKNMREVQFLGGILLLTTNYLHKKRIIHRDIKPDNIIMDHAVFLFLNF